MALSPVDIHNKKFNRGFRGYNEDEVDTFLDQVMKDMELIVKEKVELSRETNELKSKVKYFTNMESTLNQSILIAQETAETVKENAKKEAELIIKEAEKNADRIINDGLNESRKAAMEMESLKRQSNIFKARLSMLVKAQLEMINTEDWENLEDVPNLADPSFTAQRTEHVTTDFESSMFEAEQTNYQQSPIEETYAYEDEVEQQEDAPTTYVYEEEEQQEAEIPTNSYEQEALSSQAEEGFTYADEYQEEMVEFQAAEPVAASFSTENPTDLFGETNEAYYDVAPNEPSFTEEPVEEELTSFEQYREEAVGNEAAAGIAQEPSFEDSYDQYRASYTDVSEESQAEFEETIVHNPVEHTQAKQLTEAALQHASSMEEPFADDYSMDYSERSFYKYEKE